jgi:hypothetical protein
MRYRGSVEDRVHQLLSERLGNIRSMFGQIPDTLEARRVVPFKCSPVLRDKMGGEG